MYDPVTAKFLSDDPIRYGGGDTNLSRYVHNNPVMLIDPSGEFEYEPGKTYSNGSVSADGNNFILKNPVEDAQGNLRREIPIVMVNGEKVPKFDAFSRGNVTIYITGDSKFDIDQAKEVYERNIGKKLSQNEWDKLTFHHDLTSYTEHEVNGVKFPKSRMQLVPKELNNPAEGGISHVGSASVAKRTFGPEYKSFKDVVREANAALPNGADLEYNQLSRIPTVGEFASKRSKELAKIAKADSTIEEAAGKTGKVLKGLGVGMTVLGAIGSTVNAAQPGVQIMESMTDGSPIGTFYQGLLTTQSELQRGVLALPPRASPAMLQQIQEMLNDSGATPASIEWSLYGADILDSYSDMVEAAMRPAYEKNVKAQEKVDAILAEGARKLIEQEKVRQAVERRLQEFRDNLEFTETLVTKGFQSLRKGVSQTLSNWKQEWAATNARIFRERSQGVFGQTASGRRQFQPLADVRGKEAPSWKPAGFKGSWQRLGDSMLLGKVIPERQNWVFVFDE